MAGGLSGIPELTGIWFAPSVAQGGLRGVSELSGLWITGPAPALVDVPGWRSILELSGLWITGPEPAPPPTGNRLLTRDWIN